MRAVIISLVMVALLSGCSGADEQVQPTPQTLVAIDHTYPTYATVLATYVENDLVNYGALRANRAGLDSVIATIAAADLSQASSDQELAFWINAYNAITLRSIIDAYPVESIKDIDGVWDKKKWPAAGRQVTLNQIEHEIIRKEFDEPRIHVAVNCASLGCPPLAAEPYVGDRLDEQLDTASKNFATDDYYNRILPDKREASLSRIFEWYGQDFVAAYKSDTIQDHLEDKKNAALLFVLSYQPEEIQAAVRDVPLKVSYQEYDWSLNDQQP